MTTLTIYTDGAARGNPGPAGAGWVIFNSSGELLVEKQKYLGELTNNQAEYQALLFALEDAIRIGGRRLRLYSDSELMVRQILREYKVKNEGLKPLFEKVLLNLSKFSEYAVKHIPRDKNGRADLLANIAIDEYLKSSLKM